MKKKFKDVALGEKFKLYGVSYVKINNLSLPKSLRMQYSNAICLDNNHHMTFTDNALVNSCFDEIDINISNKNDSLTFTDAEYRILLAALSRERRVCEEVNEIDGSVDLIKVCDSIEKKIHNIQYR